MSSKPIIISIDGFASTGKSTLAKKISNYLEYVWSRSQGFDEHTILDELSPPLKMSVLQSLHLQNLQNLLGK